MHSIIFVTEIKKKKRMEEETPITRILHKYGLLDDEEYLIPPESEAALEMVKLLARLRHIAENGGRLTDEQKVDLKEVQIAYDYYNEALDEEVVRMTGELGQSESECEVVDDYEEDDDEIEEDEEEEEEDEDAESLEDKGIPVSKLGEIVEESDEDDSYEP